MEITEEMLDVIEEVKGKRKAGLWDPRCEQYLALKKKGACKVSKPSIKEASNSVKQVSKS